MVTDIRIITKQESSIKLAQVQVNPIEAKRVTIGEQWLDKDNRARKLTSITTSKLGKLEFHSEFPSVVQRFNQDEIVYVIW
jgi:hypothetical protein